MLYIESIAVAGISQSANPSIFCCRANMRSHTFTLYSIEWHAHVADNPINEFQLISTFGLFFVCVCGECLSRRFVDGSPSR